MFLILLFVKIYVTLDIKKGNVFYLLSLNFLSPSNYCLFSAGSSIKASLGLSISSNGFLKWMWLKRDFFVINMKAKLDIK